MPAAADKVVHTSSSELEPQLQPTTAAAAVHTAPGSCGAAAANHDGLQDARCIAAATLAGFRVGENAVLAAAEAAANEKADPTICQVDSSAAALVSASQAAAAEQLQ